MFDKLSKSIPPSIVGIAGDVIRKTIFGPGGAKGQPAKKMAESEYKDKISFQSFQSDIRARGIAKQNKFIVVFEKIPQKIIDVTQSAVATEEFTNSINYATSTDMAFIARSCESAAFPGHNLQTQDVRFQSFLSKFPVIRNYNELQLSFRCDGEMLEKKFFDLWNSAIINKRNGDISYKSDYSVNIRIIQFDEEGKPIYGTTLTNAFPFSVQDLELSHSGSEYHRLGVSIAFDKVEVMSIDNPDYTEREKQKATGLGSLSIYDRITREVFKQGKNIVLREINKKVPGGVPGIGSSRDILGGLGL